MHGQLADTFQDFFICELLELEAPKELLEVSVVVFDGLLFFYCVEFVHSHTFVEKVCCHVLSLFGQTSFFICMCTVTCACRKDG